MKAFSESGAPLAVFRDHIGKRSIDIDNKYYDDEFVVILAAPLKHGREAARSASSTSSRPRTTRRAARGIRPSPDAFEQTHTARLELTVRKKNELRAMGRMEKRTENDDSETSVWVVDRPDEDGHVLHGHALRGSEGRGRRHPAGDLVRPRLPVRATRDKLRNVGADVANSMQYFQGLLGSTRSAAEQFYVTSIAAGHGQAFDGFLHMSEWTFASEHPGASELFRAHEVAHEWFGHKVGWKSYRDQWLSEAFAEYAR